MGTMTDTKFMSLEDAAKELDVSLKTVRNYIARGLLTGYKRRTGRGAQLVSRAEVAHLQDVIPIELRHAADGDQAEE